MSPLKAFGEVSHDKHQGMGGNPAGDRSAVELMVLLCKHRHQDGYVSRHKGNLRAVYLTERGYNGPVRWEITGEVFEGLLNMAGLGLPKPIAAEWVVVAVEQSPGVLLPFEQPWQELVLDELATMEV